MLHVCGSDRFKVRQFRGDLISVESYSMFHVTAGRLFRALLVLSPTHISKPCYGWVCWHVKFVWAAVVHITHIVSSGSNNRNDHVLPRCDMLHSCGSDRSKVRQCRGDLISVESYSMFHVTAGRLFWALLMLPPTHISKLYDGWVCWHVKIVWVYFRSHVEVPCVAAAAETTFNVAARRPSFFVAVSFENVDETWTQP